MVRKITVAIILVVVAVGGLILFSYSDAVVRIVTNEKVVALTFDDGPNPPEAWVR